jgi:hypothetical protein
MKKQWGFRTISGLVIVILFIMTGCQSEKGQETEAVNAPESTTKVEESAVTALTSELTPTPDPPPSEELMTPTPELVIWSENFEDENLEGWATWWQEGEFYVDKGVLASTVGGDLMHESSVLFGTWSFDLLLDENTGTTHEFRFTEGIYNFQSMEVKQFQNTQIWITTQKDGAMPIQTYWDLAEKITGWHHFDIKKDQSGLIKVYMDEQLLFGHYDERTFDAGSLVIMYCCSGPVLDNLVVQDQVVEISSEE